LKTFTSKCSPGNQLSEYILNSKSQTYDLLPIHERNIAEMSCFNSENYCEM